MALAVNTSYLPHRWNRDILFIPALDKTLVTPKNTLTDLSRVLLNQMIWDGMHFTIFTARTPDSLMEPMNDVALRIPVIAAYSALFFDLKEKHYVKKSEIPYATVKRVLDYFAEHDLTSFVTSVVDDVLLIYYEGFNNEAETILYEELCRLPYRNCIRSAFSREYAGIYLMVLLPDDMVGSLLWDMSGQDFAKDLCFRRQLSEYEGYTYLKVCDQDVSRRRMMEYLRTCMGLKEGYYFWQHRRMYDIVVHDHDINTVVKALKRLYKPYWWDKSLP